MDFSIIKPQKFPILSMLFWFLGGIVFTNQFCFSIQTSGYVLATSIIFVVAFFMYYFKKFSFGIAFSVSVYVFAFGLGMFSYSVHYQPFYNNHYTKIASEKPALLVATVTERLKPTPKNEKYFLEIKQIHQQKTFGKILLNAPKTAIKPLKTGTKLLIYSALLEIIPPKNPNQFNYQKYLANQEVYKQVYLTNDNFKVVGQEKKFEFYVANFREKLIQSFDIHHFKPQVKHLIEALIFGQRQDVEGETLQQFSQTGVMHVLAISGLHIGIIYLFLQGFLQLFLFFKKHPWVEFMFLMLFLWSFALLSGFSASVVRAVVMFTFFALGKALNKNYQTFNIWAVAMFLMLLFEPKYLFEVGFQLSFLAVFSIAWFLPLMQKIPKVNHKVINYFIDTLKITFAAQIGVLPLSLYYFHQFPMLFFVANLVVIPLSTAVLILGMLIIPFNFFLPKIAYYLGLLLEFFTSVMLKSVEFLSNIELNNIQNIHFSGFLTFLSYIFLAFISYFLFTRKFIFLQASIISFMVLQSVSFYEKYTQKQSSECVVFQHFGTTLAFKNHENITIYSSDSLIKNKTIMLDYLRDKPFKIKYLPLQNLYYFKHKKIIVVDDDYTSIDNLPSADVLVLSKGINLKISELITKIKPKILIIDGSNPKKLVEFVEKIAQQSEIKIYSTYKDGFYKIN